MRNCEVSDCKERALGEITILKRMSWKMFGLFERESSPWPRINADLCETHYAQVKKAMLEILNNGVNHDS